MAREQKRPPIEVLTERLAAGQDAVADGLGRIADALTPPDEPLVQIRDLRRTDTAFFAQTPVMKLAFRRVVPKGSIQSQQPGLAVVDCPCGATVEIAEGEHTACHGPEGGECPRFYLNTGTDVRVANTELLEAEWADRKGPTTDVLRARAIAERGERALVD